MHTNPSSQASAYASHYLTPRFNFNRPRAERAKGVFIYDENGRDYLDASGGAMTVSIGHGVPEILSAMHAQAEKSASATVLNSVIRRQKV